MHHRTYCLPTVAALLLAASPCSHAASGFGALLKGTNFAAFSDADMKIFLNAAETTVRSQPDGVEVRWNSDKSGSTGTMHVARSYEHNAHACRELKGETIVKARAEPYTLTYCKDSAGHWRLASSTAP